MNPAAHRHKRTHRLTAAAVGDSAEKPVWEEFSNGGKLEVKSVPLTAPVAGLILTILLASPAAVQRLSGAGLQQLQETLRPQM